MVHTDTDTDTDTNTTLIFYSIDKPDKPGVFILTLYSACPVVDLPQPTNLMRRGQARPCAILPVSVIIDILRKIFKRLSKNLQ